MPDDFEIRLASLEPRPPSIKDYVREHAIAIRKRISDGVAVKKICVELSKSLNCDVKPATLLTYLTEIAPVMGGKRGRPSRLSVHRQRHDETSTAVSPRSAASSSADVPAEVTADLGSAVHSQEAHHEVPKPSEALKLSDAEGDRFCAGWQTEKNTGLGAPVAVTPSRLK